MKKKAHPKVSCRLQAESVTVPLQCLLCLLAIFMPRRDDDVLPRTRQGIGFIVYLHVEARGINVTHSLRGIVITEEIEPAKLAQDGLAILVVPIVICKELMLAV